MICQGCGSLMVSTICHKCGWKMKNELDNVVRELSGKKKKKKKNKLDNVVEEVYNTLSIAPVDAEIVYINADEPKAVDIGYKEIDCTHLAPPQDEVEKIYLRNLNLAYVVVDLGHAKNILQAISMIKSKRVKVNCEVVTDYNCTNLYTEYLLEVNNKKYVIYKV
jgi:hypothetical protein